MQTLNKNSLCTVSSDTRTGRRNKRSQIQNEQKGDFLGCFGGFWWGFGDFFFIQDVLDSLAFLAKGCQKFTGTQRETIYGNGLHLYFRLLNTPTLQLAKEDPCPEIIAGAWKSISVLPYVFTLLLFRLLLTASIVDRPTFGLTQCGPYLVFILLKLNTKTENIFQNYTAQLLYCFPKHASFLVLNLSGK